jgi:hypothetical protein
VEDPAPTWGAAVLLRLASIIPTPCLRAVERLTANLTAKSLDYSQPGWTTMDNAPL